MYQYFELLLKLILVLTGFEIDGYQCYQPNRILVLVLEELREDLIQAPVAGLLQETVIDMVSCVPWHL